MAEKQQEEEKGQFSEETFSHVLEEEESDYDDFTEADLLTHPELGFTEEQVKQEELKLSPQEKKVYEELRQHHLLQYRTRGFMTPIKESIKEAVHKRYPSLPGSASTTIAESQDKLYEQFKEKSKDGACTDNGIDFSIVKPEVKQ